MPLHLSIDQRWHIVHLHQDLKLTQQQIATKMKCGQQTVSYILKKYKQTKDVIDRPHSGRPRSLSIDNENQLEQAIHSTPNATSTELQSYMNWHLQKQILIVKHIQKF
jgi:transposase